MAIKVHDWIFTKQSPNKQLEVLSIGEETVYCADEKGDGIEINKNDIVSYGKRILRDIHNQRGRF